MISRFFVIILFLNLCVSGSVRAQGEKEFIKQRIDQLASPGFHGRGYVMNGGNIAAQYIADEFKSYGVLPLGQNGSYFQDYNFSINTFPGRVFVQVNKTVLKPGPDYIVNAASSAWHAHAIIRYPFQSTLSIRTWLSNLQCDRPSSAQKPSALTIRQVL